MKNLHIIAALAADVTSLQAGESAFQLSLTPDIALHPQTTEISGVSLDIRGENPQHGFNLGLINVINSHPWFDEFPDKLARGFHIVNWSF
jgi:hypothetical protein